MSSALGEKARSAAINKIPGGIYGRCYDPPLIFESVSMDCAGYPPERNGREYLSADPIRHYVGWSQQTGLNRRISNHYSAGPAVTVTLGRGTMEREEEISARPVARPAVASTPIR
jgi:hypothetical protein